MYGKSTGKKKDQEEEEEDDDDELADGKSKNTYAFKSKRREVCK